ncbi:MAG: BPSS1780 family membrane protein [Burkholderiaceae bacterium]
MQAATLPATAGWHWTRDGFMLFAKQPLAVFMWAMGIMLFVSLAAITAPIGPLFFISVMPVITVLTLSACKHIAADRVMLPSMWFKPLRQPGMVRRLVVMGMLYGGVSLLAGMIAFMPFARDIAQAMQLMQATQEVMPFFEAVGPALAIFTLLYVVIAAVFWHAPVLVAWHHIKLGQALFFSAIACWRNKWPFLVYGLTWFGVFMAIDVAAGILVWLGLSVGFTEILKMPFNMAACGALYCSFYPTYVSVFDIENRPYQPVHDHPTPVAHEAGDRVEHAGQPHQPAQPGRGDATEQPGNDQSNRDDR